MPLPRHGRRPIRRLRRLRRLSGGNGYEECLTPSRKEGKRESGNRERENEGPFEPAAGLSAVALAKAEAAGDARRPRGNGERKKQTAGVGEPGTGNPPLSLAGRPGNREQARGMPRDAAAGRPGNRKQARGMPRDAAAGRPGTGNKPAACRGMQRRAGRESGMGNRKAKKWYRRELETCNLKL